MKSPRDKSSNSKYAKGTPQYREVSPGNKRFKTIGHGRDYPSFRPENNNQYDEYGESHMHEEEEYQKYNSRFGGDPSEKIHYVREIARLKGEIKSLQSD